MLTSIVSPSMMADTRRTCLSVPVGMHPAPCTAGSVTVGVRVTVGVGVRLGARVAGGVCVSVGVRVIVGVVLRVREYCGVSDSRVVGGEVYVR